MIVFDKLWETMKAKHVSTYALRDRFDIDSRTIRRLRANQTVTTDTLDKLCRILDCKLYEIAEYLPEEAEKGGTDSVPPFKIMHPFPYVKRKKDSR